MNAIAIAGAGLVWETAPNPVLGPGDVQIDVAATAVNRADLIQRAGRYNAPSGASSILGLECAGVVSAAHPDANWRVGDRVCALLSGGGYAEVVVCPGEHVLPVPDDITLEQAAALPEVMATAWVNLRAEAGLGPGERVLVHAGASGVGTAAVQLCAMWGNPCWVTVGSDAKVAQCIALGAEGGTNRHAKPWYEAVQGRFDVILDPVGEGYLEHDLRLLEVGGRIVIIGLMGGRGAPLDLGRLLVKRLRIIGSVLRSRSREEKADIIAGVHRDVWPHVASGAVVPVIHTVMDIREAEAAHALIASNATVGKVVLRVAG
jgi:putative PIG3 family NAD(P)H quinone oxidoreductase